MNRLLDLLSRREAYGTRNELAAMAQLPPVTETGSNNALMGAIHGLQSATEGWRLAPRAPQFMSAPDSDLGRAASMAAEIGMPDPSDLGALTKLGMTLFHGSPHKFNKFSLDKIGTGEGAQAYGHGLYFAESPGVASTYKSTHEPLSRTIDGERIKQIDHDSVTLESGKVVNLTHEQAQHLQYQTTPTAMQASVDYWRGKNNRIADELDALAKRMGFGDAGSLYEVDIPDEAIDRMLDWDKPLSEQPESVRKAVAALIGDDWAADVANYPENSINGIPSGWAKLSGEEILGAIKNRLGLRADQASAALNKSGIPGIKYLDGTSRSAGEGTRNFVVFDENIIKPLTRNGQPIK